MVIQRVVDIIGQEPVGSTSNCKSETTLVLSLHRKDPLHDLVGRTAPGSQELLRTEPNGSKVRRPSTRSALTVAIRGLRSLHADQSIIKLFVGFSRIGLSSMPHSRRTG